MSAMINRALLRAPRLCQEAVRGLPAVSSPFPRHTSLKYGQVRTLTSASPLATDHQLPSSSSSPGSVTIEEKGVAAPQINKETSQHVPWYLQEETSVPASEVSSQDKLPELPENPPKILPELTEYVFKDLGLDNLKFIDLRALENPPPLGANVIMLIGTARSVKHLNVSADRLCRWLRSSYKLTPYADGLLGRNELKIKLRRKTRRARIASKTGGFVDEKDDGITTGWICVNVGVVEKGAAIEQQDGVFEGFGHLTRDTKMVVQMFTEEKRAEMDLETLWTGRIERAQKAKEQGQSEVDKNAPEQVRSPSLQTATTPQNRTPSDYQSLYLPRSTSLPLEQRRQLHTQIKATSFNITSETQLLLIAESFPEESIEHAHALLKWLSSAENGERIHQAIGSGLDDQTSTQFLRQFYKSIASSSSNTRGIAQLDLICTAIFAEHSGYTRESLHRIFKQCCIDAAEFPDPLLLRIVDAVLAPRISEPDEDGQVEPYFTDADRELASDVINHVLLRHEMNFMTLEWFTKLYYLACLPLSPGENDTMPGDRGSYVLRMIDQINIPYDPVQARSLMVMMFDNGDYDNFFKWWRRLPLKNSPRTYEDYEVLFMLHSELRDGIRARSCLYECAPMMQREEPPIPLEGKLVWYILDCIKLAEPDIEQVAEDKEGHLLPDLWRKCREKIWEEEPRGTE
ncbi:ATPase synthesis protein 25, mitochondrial [Aspergillus karnatakaensis]|uniref:RsfS/YbeB/iojap family protein n=1 Tax=Aspergillus karnatakaensis TaxID=1810916 RepID=UPI003CCCF83B